MQTDLPGITHGNGQFVAVGIGGNILQSGSIFMLTIATSVRHGLLSLTVKGPTGLEYTIQTSTDSVSWRDVRKISNAQSGRVILDALVSSSDRQFYRAYSE